MLKKLLSIFIIALFGLITVRPAYAVPPVSGYFSDKETSTNNSFSATTLDFSLRDTSDTVLTSPLFNDTGIVPVYSSSKTIRIKKDGLADFKYNISAIITGGDAVLCNALQVEADIDGGAMEYSGSLTGLTLAPIAAISGSEDDWEMTVKLTDNSAGLQSKSCLFNFKVSGWQIGSDGTWGLMDQEEIGNTISSGHWIPPAITNINVLIATPNDNNEKTATVTWTTDELATGNLDWKIDGGGLTSIVTDTSADTTTHTQEITGLLADTTYYYQVKSSDVFGNETVSAEQMFETDNERAGLPPWSDIVINEYLPNPIGPDDAPMPGGEWVELYNRGTTTKDLAGWYVTDADNSHKLYLTPTNTESSDPTTSGLNIAPNEFFVVYRNGNSDFDLNNEISGDTVKLFGIQQLHVGPFTWTVALLKDFHTYIVLLGDTVLENKSFARFPDGSNTWFDPIPSPGGPNQLETAPVDNGLHFDVSTSNDKKSVRFNIYGDTLSQYDSFTYTVSYDSEQGQQGIMGEKKIENKNDIEVNTLLLGTCSSGGTCTYHLGVSKVTFEVVLKGQETITLEKELSL